MDNTGDHTPNNDRLGRLTNEEQFCRSSIIRMQEIIDGDSPEDDIAEAIKARDEYQQMAQDLDRLEKWRVWCEARKEIMAFVHARREEREEYMEMSHSSQYERVMRELGTLVANDQEACQGLWDAIDDVDVRDYIQSEWAGRNPKAFRAPDIRSQAGVDEAKLKELAISSRTELQKRVIQMLASENEREARDN